MNLNSVELAGEEPDYPAPTSACRFLDQFVPSNDVREAWLIVDRELDAALPPS